MLNTVEIENYYEIRVEFSNKLLGRFIKGVDGFFYFEAENNNGGLWSDYVLLELGTKLREINKPLNDHFDNYIKLNN
jgi:hypothetical protein